MKKLIFAGLAVVFAVAMAFTSVAPTAYAKDGERPPFCDCYWNNVEWICGPTCSMGGGSTPAPPNLEF